jgi:hypothetical protein
MINELERLSAIEAIKQLKAAYFTAIDSKDTSACAALFTDDAVIDIRGAITPTEGRMPDLVLEAHDKHALMTGGRSFAEFLAAAGASFDSVHHGFTPEIKILSESTARGVWPMEDRLWFHRGSCELLHGFGHYLERYLKVGGVWKIASMKITRQRVIAIARQ